MMSTTSRRFILLLGGLSFCSIVLLLSWLDPTGHVQISAIFKNTVGSLIAKPVPFSSSCALFCFPDPFSRPGVLVQGEGYIDSRWIPFPPRQEDANRTKAIDIHLASPIPDDALNLASPQYMKLLLGNESKPEMEWVRNRTILFIGSSHDRNNLKYFCDKLKGKYSTIGGHTAGACKLLVYNFTMAFWFTYGSVDSEDYDWFAEHESRPLSFEHKIKTVMLPWSLQQGIGRPDLVIETSLFWDDNFLNQLARKRQAPQNAALTYAELEWHRSRIHDLVTYTRNLFGHDIPLMFRSRHIRESNRWNRVLRIFQLDQNLRMVAQERNVKLFRWGDLLEGYTDFYDSDQHFNLGPPDWLFGDMALFYLKQAVTPGCWTCFDYPQ